MKQTSTTTIQIALYISLGTILYLVYTYLNYHYFKFDAVILGVVHEMVMIPILLLQPVLIIVSLFYIFKTTNKYKILLAMSIFANIIAIGSVITEFAN